MQNNTQHRTDHGRLRRRLRPALVLATMIITIAMVASCASGQVVVPAGPGDPTPSGSGSPAAGGPPPPPPPPVRPRGNIKQKSTAYKVNRKPELPLTQTGEFSDDVTVKVTNVQPVRAEAIGPGEVGGPAVSVTVMIKNGSAESIDLATASVTLLGSDGSPGLMTTGGDASPLSGVLEPDTSASGVYIFTIAKKLRKPITVEVQYGSGRTILQFSGDAR